MPLELLPHDPRWAAYFDEVESLLCGVLGRYALDIQHVGSTSIAGIVAKPVIDVAVAIEQYPLPDEVLTAVEALGYNYLGEYGLPHRHLFFQRGGPVGYNIHINKLANNQFQRHVLFRDYLRAHPNAAREYELLKLELAAQHDDVNTYANSKSEFVQDILRRAYLWREGR
ncbi:MAG TPA: GrpB family protein [Chloroflexia bacterium]|jgi:GrpB-like predicted nucleotidyltransferase (UPF0157 family)|nr:GrpB family protein [Chloroflexia bacterium]